MRSQSPVRIGETVFSLDHFVKTLADPQRPLLTRRLQNHLILSCLREIPLKYFSGKAPLFPLAKIFSRAIRRLKHFRLSPAALREALKEAGSLKEYDLLQTFELYEEGKEKLSAVDEEDLYELARKNVPHNKELKEAGEIRFEDFPDFHPALKEMIGAIRKACPSLRVECAQRPVLSPQSFEEARVSLSSLSSPRQEVDWFLNQTEGWLKEGLCLEQIGIVAGNAPVYFEAIWQRLKQAGFCEGPSPFLGINETVAGRRLLNEARHLGLEKASLTRWLETLLGKTEEGEAKTFLEPFLFAEECWSLDKLEMQEWLSWLETALGEKQTPPVPRALEGLQWISPEERDRPELKHLWVPGFVWGQFPLLETQPFFQQPQDRSRKEWKTLAEAFEDPQALFEKRRQDFLNLLQCSRKSWLTYPRLDSQGKDLFYSPFGFDFGPVAELPSPPPPVFVTAPLSRKLAVEQERRTEDLQSKAYHAHLDREIFPEKLPVQEADYLFSPSQLETFAQCPFKFFAQRVLQIPKLKEYSPAVDPEDKGSLFHDCLERLFSREGELFKQAIKDASKERELNKKLKVIVEEVFREYRPRLDYANRELYEHLKEETIFKSGAVLEMELKGARILPNPLTPAHFEWCFGASTQDALVLPCATSREAAFIGGRIDRIDVEPGKKRFLVLDYKTGNVGSLKEKLLQGLFLQLPLYILAVRTLLLKDHETAGGLLIEVKKGEKKQGMVDKAFNKSHFHLHSRAGALLKKEELENLLARVAEQVGIYVTQIREGYFSPTPKACHSYCDYREICRYPGKPVD